MEDYKGILEALEKWTAIAMDRTGGDQAVIGISGGKDSSVTAALMVRVLGAENVVGVLMPDGMQSDIHFAEAIVQQLGIHSMRADIQGISGEFRRVLESCLPEAISAQTTLNLPPRIRMTLLYAIAQSIPGARVINTSNLSEDWVGYATVYGDTAGAFSPLGMLTTEEVIEIGRLMGIPDQFLLKPPADGLTGRTDEDVLGVSYPVINRYIRTGQASLAEKELIDRLHRVSRFKFLPIPMFDPELPISAEDPAGVYRKKI